MPSRSWSWCRMEPCICSRVHRGILGWGRLLLLCWAVFGLTMNGDSNLMHEAAHYHVALTPCEQRLGALVAWAADPRRFRCHRQRHWDHHRRLGESNDPKTTYRVDVHGPRHLLFRCLVLVEAVHRWQVCRAATNRPRTRVWRNLRILRLATAQVLYSWPLRQERRDNGYDSIENAAVAYLVVSAYGLASVTVLAATMRQPSTKLPATWLSTSGAAALRNFSCNMVTRAIFGAYRTRDSPRATCIPLLPSEGCHEGTCPDRQGLCTDLWLLDDSWICSFLSRKPKVCPRRDD